MKDKYFNKFKCKGSFTNSVLRCYKDSLTKITIATHLQNNSTLEFGRIMKREKY